MTVADPVPLGVERAYRQAAAAGGMPVGLDDAAYGRGLAAAAALRALQKLDRFDKLDARPAGHHSRPQLVVTIERAVATMDRWDDHHPFGPLSAWLAAVAGTLRRRWPDADLVFPDDYSLREPFDPEH